MSKLTEANKFLFGTENLKEVKRLFENEQSVKKDFMKIDLSELFGLDEKRYKKTLKWYQSKLKNIKWMDGIVDDIIEGYQEDPALPICHNFCEQLSEDEETSKECVRICKNEQGSKEWFTVWFIMNFALCCVIKGSGYDLDDIEFEYADDAYCLFLAMVKEISNSFYSTQAQQKIIDQFYRRFLSETNA